MKVKEKKRLGSIPSSRKGVDDIIP
jgi:hypothetical protein